MVGALLSALALTVFGADGAGGCPPVRILAPASGETITVSRPSIEWHPVPGATGYRLRLLSRVPNGRVVASHDTVVSELLFAPPQPLAEQSTKVVVRLNAICGKETSADSLSSFIIDTSPRCVMSEVGVSMSGAKVALRWPAVAGASRYDVRAYGVADGQLIASQETRTPAAQLELKGRSAVVSVQPTCSAGMGEAAYRVVTPR